MFSKIIYWFLIAIAVIQFIPIDRTNPPVKPQETFSKILHTPENVQNSLEKACFDCHSNETKYPKYACVAPISWSIKHHINEGREHLNFSVWGTYNKDLKTGMLKNTIAALKDNSMPMPGYMAYHPEANLTAAERKMLIDYFEALLSENKY